jgi:hypothetical protein
MSDLDPASGPALEEDDRILVLSWRSIAPWEMMSETVNREYLRRPVNWFILAGTLLAGKLE